MPSQVFFDFFGTLVDYDPSIHPTYNAPLAFARMAGLTISAEAVDEQWRRAWGQLDDAAAETGREFSMHEVAQQYWHTIGAPSLPAGAIETLIADYIDAWTEKVAIAAGAHDCVEDLTTDHRLAVVSNTHHPELVPRLLRKFGLHNAIETVITSVTIGWRKPHPKIFETALRQCGVAATDAVFVGDNWQADIEGPRAIGMAAVYVGPANERTPTVTLTDLPHVIRSLS
ncbi:HAD family hydrolase [Mycolicibacterium agri]|uniref:HAD family hydrolase n=1 Tax=Mycolicibacterium agri TaxID=36811 RepID=A0A2A7N480_MYCAG|nr:HAD family hydrolase [Mycolicibacterium agri]GFG53556.1 HAD family hydrolase [Mycolicibacterium agri]